MKPILKSTRGRLLTGTVLPLAMVAGLSMGQMAVAQDEATPCGACSAAAADAENPCAASADAENPCAAAADAENPCNPCSAE